MGKTVRNSIYRSSVPLVIVKEVFKREESETKGFNYLVCLDGSKKSYKALETGYKLCTHKNDKLYACFACTPDNRGTLDAIKIEVDQRNEENSPKCCEIQELNNPSRSHTDTILDHINLNENIYFHFVLVFDYLKLVWKQWIESST